MSAKKILITSSIFLMALAATVPAAAASRYTTTRHHRGHVRRVAWNPVLKGSMDSMVRQNEEIDRLQLPRIADNEQLLELERTQELVPIQETRALRVNASLQADKRYCRPWCNQFLQDMSEAYFAEFHTPLQVNSAVRTMEQQQKLRRHNRNAAPEMGEHASSHLAGRFEPLARSGNLHSLPGLRPRKGGNRTQLHLVHCRAGFDGAAAAVAVFGRSSFTVRGVVSGPVRPVVWASCASVTLGCTHSGSTRMCPGVQTGMGTSSSRMSLKAWKRQAFIVRPPW